MAKFLAKPIIGKNGGDEGGEILLEKADTNTSIAGTGVTIDIWQNRLRFFEQGGDARGAYIDITAASNGVGSNLLAGGGGGATTLDGLTDVTAPSPSNGDFLKWNGTAWVNDAIDLATDTTGSYVSSLVAGTGITLSNNSGEAATPTISVDTSATLPSGSMQMYAGSSAPSGWFLCDGSEKAISSYGALYAVLGTTYGALTNGSGGAGTTHFRVPDMCSRMPIGAGAGTGLTSRTLGATGGAETVTIISSNLPTHTHTLSAHTHTSAAHAHTSAAHSHTLGNHTHTGPLHAHNIPRGLIATAGTNRAVVSTANNQATLNTGDSGTAGTGFPSSDATNSVTPGDTGSTTPSATGAPSTDATGDGGFANSALAMMNPFLAVNFIIKT